MQAQWQKVFVKIAFWLIAEIILNLLGLDNLADYSEFIFEGKAITIESYTLQLTSRIPAALS